MKCRQHNSVWEAVEVGNAMLVSGREHACDHPNIINLTEERRERYGKTYGYFGEDENRL